MVSICLFFPSLQVPLDDSPAIKIINTPFQLHIAWRFNESHLVQVIKKDLK